MNAIKHHVMQTKCRDGALHCKTKVELPMVSFILWC